MLPGSPGYVGTAGPGARAGFTATGRQVSSLAVSAPAGGGELGTTEDIKKIPWRRARPPTPVFLPGESHAQGSLAGCGPWGHTEPD